MKQFNNETIEVMNIFNSLGSNYNFDFVLRALFANNKPSHSSNLKSYLEKKYQGQAVLVYKGREAIGLALNILKLSQMSSRGSGEAGDVAIPSEERLLLRQLTDRNDNSSYVTINGFTCFAVYKAIETAGYEPICLDLDSNLDINFSPDELSKAIRQNPKIKAVIIQNTLGFPCDIEKIAKICKDNNIILIEDLAHSVGTIYEKGKEAGTVGDFVVLSFSQDKIIDAVSGGALIIRNKKYQNYILASQGETLGLKQQLLDRFYPLFTFIIRKTYRIGIGRPIHFLFKTLNLLLKPSLTWSKPMNEGFYTKYNLPGWYAYLAMDAFTNLNKNLEHRRKIADIYSKTLSKKILLSAIIKHIPLSSNLRFPIFVENRRSLIEYLKKECVYVSDVWYDDVDKSLPNAQVAASTILNLPTHINVSEEDAKNIAQKINQSLTPPLSLRERARVRVTSQNDGVAMNFVITTKTIGSKKEWEDFLEKHAEANFLQSWYWGEFHKNLNNIIQRTGFYNGGKITGIMLSVVEDAKRGRYLTVPGGPIIDWDKPNLIKAFVEEIKRIAKEYSCVFVRVRPQLESYEFSKSLFKRHGFINAPMHLHAELTSQLDITKDEQTLLSQMRKTTRYEIRKAINQKIKITASTDPSLIKKFYELQIETAKRQKFVPFSYKYLSEQFKVFATEDKVLLYSAYHENKLLAQAFVIFYGKEAVYHYGASTDEGRKYGGAYLIQWEAILEAKRRGMTRYNFWGVSPIDKPDHRFSGLSLFKRGFGGQDVEYLHAQDLIISRAKYIINYAIESIRKKIRNV